MRLVLDWAGQQSEGRARGRTKAGPEPKRGHRVEIDQSDVVKGCLGVCNNKTTTQGAERQEQGRGVVLVRVLVRVRGAARVGLAYSRS